MGGRFGGGFAGRAALDILGAKGSIEMSSRGGEWIHSADQEQS